MSVSGLSLYIQFSCVGVCVSIDLTKTIKTSYVSQIIASLNLVLFIKNIKKYKIELLSIFIPPVHQFSSIYITPVTPVTFWLHES